jgi:prevent-host-death family protein
MIRTSIAVLTGGVMHTPTVKFSEDVVPLGDLKVNPGRVVRRVDETGRPVLLTSHGRGVAVVQGLSQFEAVQEERDFMRAVVAGLADIDAGRTVSLDEVKRELGLT